MAESELEGAEPQETGRHEPGAQPRGRLRCRALLDAAADLFVEKGYAATSLTEILERAGGSRATLYKHFGDKEGLFRTMMEEHCAQILETMVVRRESDGTDRPEERLFQLGMQISDTLVSQQTIAILRTLVSEGARIPDIVESFFRIGPQQTNGRITDYFLELAEAGLIAVDSPQSAAQAFTGMIAGNLLMRRLILPEEAIPRADTEAYVRSAVHLFLQGAAPQSG
ncbi:TetR/AcrR family transcriptional regulator [Azospirillum thermophilum]|uniref:TetR/AcrR family transcriptional regulator n=1 Tax=Azospirillum thermophilum TaxID=2202148 RepID=A0A2S2CUW7_9PROT|nr:TetR/AcrR family transcriptional regulator [Azospirillum thermophilum]AWK88278.1 TetR/AcrR family transcriptional regulator [Azospirillum thermophilum]